MFYNPYCSNPIVKDGAMNFILGGERCVYVEGGGHVVASHVPPISIPLHLLHYPPNIKDSYVAVGKRLIYATQ